MKVFLIIGRGFEGMANRMTKIEHRAIIIFALILLYDFRFDSARRGNDLRQQAVIQANKLFDFLFQQFE